MSTSNRPEGWREGCVSTVEELVRLMDDASIRDWQKRWVPATSEAWIAYVNLHPDRLDAAALNKVLPEEAMAHIFNCGDWRVKTTIADKRRVWPSTVVLMARDDDPEFRLGALARMQAWGFVDEALLAVLADDPDERVRARARSLAAGERSGDVGHNDLS